MSPDDFDKRLPEFKKYLQTPEGHAFVREALYKALQEATAAAQEIERTQRFTGEGRKALFEPMTI